MLTGEREKWETEAGGEKEARAWEMKKMSLKLQVCEMKKTMWKLEACDMI